MNKATRTWMVKLFALVFVLIGLTTFGDNKTNENFIETIYDAAGNPLGNNAPIDIDIPIEQGVGEDAPPVNDREYDPVGDIDSMLELHRALNQSEASPVPVASTTRDPNWWHNLQPLPPPNSTPEEIYAFAKTFPAEASIIMLKELYGIEIEGAMLGEGSPEKGDLWTPEQLFYILWGVHEMPPWFTKYTKYICRVQRLPAYPSAYAYVVRGQPRVYFCDAGIRPGLERTLIHEMAHVWMFDPENKSVADEFTATFWPQGYSIGTPTTAYAHTNVYEDFAEAVACFWEDPLKMQKRSPDRFNFILKKVVGYYSLTPVARSKGVDFRAPKL